MKALKVQIDVLSTGNPQDVEFTVFEYTGGVGWVPAGTLVASDVDSFAADLATELTSKAAGNDFAHV